MQSVLGGAMCYQPRLVRLVAEEAALAMPRRVLPRRTGCAGDATESAVGESTLSCGGADVTIGGSRVMDEVCVRVDEVFV